MWMNVTVSCPTIVNKYVKIQLAVLSAGVPLALLCLMKVVKVYQNTILRKHDFKVYDFQLQKNLAFNLDNDKHIHNCFTAAAIVIVFFLFILAAFSCKKHIKISRK